MLVLITRVKYIFLIFFSLSVPFSAFAALSCSITTAAECTSPSIIMIRMSSSTNAHAELSSQSTAGYASNVICCSGGTGLDNSCSGTFAVVAKLSAVTNAHIEQSSLSNYANNACMSVTAGTVSIVYQSSNCTGYDTTLASMTASTNAHVGSPADYTTKICGSVAGAASQSLTFSISTNSIGFGTLSSGAVRYATSDANGTSTEAEAHQLSANTNASSGYVITVQGASLTAGSYSIDAIGGSNTASSAGSEQFGVRATASGGVGSVTAPYAASGFAYAATATTTSQVASASSGNGVTTTYSTRYLANIAATTEASDYSAALVYVITANF